MNQTALLSLDMKLVLFFPTHSGFQRNLSQTSIENEDYDRCDLDITPNSHDNPAGTSWENNRGNKRVKMLCCFDDFELQGAKNGGKNISLEDFTH